MGEPAPSDHDRRRVSWLGRRHRRPLRAGGWHRVAMAPANHVHGVIVGNAYAAIRAGLDGRATCEGVVEAGIRVDPANHYKADVAASCAEPTQSPYRRGPFLIVEVAFRKHLARRHRSQAPALHRLPSVREIWLIDSRERWVQVWRRGETPGSSPCRWAKRELREQFDRRPDRTGRPLPQLPAFEPQFVLTSSAPTAFAKGSPRSNAAMFASVVSTIPARPRG